MAHSIHVVHLQRRAPAGRFSVERLSEDVRAALPPDIEVDLRINRHESRGIVSRITDAVSARLARGSVRHVLGDVHYLTWFLPRRGTVLTVLDCVLLERMRGPRLWIFWLLWYWWPLRRTDQVIVISQYIRESLLGWVRYPADRVHVIPPPLSREFQASPPPARGARLRLLQVGTGPNKNLIRVVEAVSELPVTLVIIGPLNDLQRAQLTRLGVPYENHLDLGRDELRDQYRRADAVVFASTYEGFGLPIIEAQAIGRPVVTSNICSMPEAAGGAACLVNPLDVADIRRGIRRLLNDAEYCDELVSRGRTNASLYSPARIAGEYANVYRNAYERAKRSK